MRAAIALLLCGCWTSSVVVRRVPPTLVASVVVATPGDAGVSPSAVAGWDSADAGDAPLVEQSTRGVALVPDAGWYAFGPSCIVAAPRCEAAGQELAGWKAQRDELERVPPGVRPQLVAAFVGFGLGVLTGLAVAVAGCEASTGSPICLKH